VLKIIRKKEAAKFQWLQNPSQTNEDNLNNVRHETSNTVSNKKKEYLKDKINEFETNNKNKNIWLLSAIECTLC
jgi:hypothetical protein